MKEVEQLVYQRMIADNAAGGILNLLGNSITAPITVTRILHSHQNIDPPSPGLTYGILATVPGHLEGDFTRTLEVTIAFTIFAENYAEVAFRLRRLFDGWTHSLSLISGGAMQVGGVSSVFDFEGPDGFDESLQVQKKDLRYRFFVKPKAQNPI
jgi:hypothetical protein